MDKLHGIAWNATAREDASTVIYLAMSVDGRMVNAFTNRSVDFADNVRQSVAFRTVSASTTFVRALARNALAGPFVHMEK